MRHLCITLSASSSSRYDIQLQSKSRFFIAQAFEANIARDYPILLPPATNFTARFLVSGWLWGTSLALGFVTTSDRSVVCV